jgi:16S rRNA (uracil1498-N3)-methyltransferase
LIKRLEGVGFVKQGLGQAPRLFINAPLTVGARLELAPEQVHYLAGVLRLQGGAAVLAFNGNDGEWLTRFEPTAKKKGALLCESQIRAQPVATDLWLLFAPLKSARLDYLVQKAVEMGASQVLPVFTERTQAQRFNADRARANMIEAAEQCGILGVPELQPENTLVRLLRDWPKDRRMIFCDEAAEVANPVDSLTGHVGEPLALIIGPEGGFSDTEREALMQLPKVTRLSLGPRILRADTAAVAAMAVIQAIAGDWRMERS